MGGAGRIRENSREPDLTWKPNGVMGGRGNGDGESV